MNKYNTISEATVKGRMHANKFNIRWTKTESFSKNMNTNITTPNLIHSIYKSEESYDDISRNNTVIDTPTAF